MKSQISNWEKPYSSIFFTANDRYTNHLVYHLDLKPNFPGPVKWMMSIRIALHLTICSFIHLLTNSQNFSLLNCNYQLYSLQTREPSLVETYSCLKPCWILLLRVIGPQLPVGQCRTDHKALADCSTHRQSCAGRHPALKLSSSCLKLRFNRR